MALRRFLTAATQFGSRIASLKGSFPSIYSSVNKVDSSLANKPSLDFTWNSKQLCTVFFLPRINSLNGQRSLHTSATSCAYYHPPPISELKLLHRKHYYVPKKKPKRRSVLGGAPQLKGVVLKTLIKKPKKPNSANRKCVLVRLSNGREAFAHVPGEGHNLQEHNIVLVRGGNVRDVPGLRLKVVRGKYDCAHVIKRKRE